MGKVYRARDTRLGRDVAIKICAEQFSERFEHEARAVAALNHPNICTLHDVGPNYLVMEYIFSFGLIQFEMLIGAIIRMITNSSTDVDPAFTRYRC